MKKRLIKVLLVFFIATFSFVILPVDTVLAEGEDGDYEVDLQKETDRSELIEKYEELEDAVSMDKGLWIQDLLRLALYGTSTFLIMCVDYLENGVDKILTMNHFYEHAGVKNLMKILTPYAMGLFLIALIVLGYQFMWNKVQKRDEVIMNVLLAFSLILIVPNLFTYMDKILSEGLDGLKDDSSLAQEVLKTNTADLQVYIDSRFDTAGKDQNNYAGNDVVPPRPTNRSNIEEGTSNWKYANKLEGTKIEITEKFNIHADEGWFKWTTEDWIEKLEDNNPLAYDFLRHKPVANEDGKTYSLRRLAENQVPMTEIGQESYFRYKVKFGTVIVSLLITAFVLGITIVKIGRIMFELAFNMIFSMFVASTDLTGGQRMKKVVTEIVSGFGVLFVMVLILKMFIYYANWANEMRTDVGTLVYLLLLIAGAWVVIDAPDIVTRVLGIDAGLRSGYQAMMGAWAGSKMAGSLGKNMQSLGGKAIGGMQNTRAFMRGLSGKQKPMPSFFDEEGRDGFRIDNNNLGNQNEIDLGNNKGLDIENSQDNMNRDLEKDFQSKMQGENKDMRSRLMDNGDQGSLGRQQNDKIGERKQSDVGDRKGGTKDLNLLPVRGGLNNGSIRNRTFSTTGANQPVGRLGGETIGDRKSFSGAGEDPYRIDLNNNPYQTDTFLGGSAGAKHRAEQKARAYNSGRDFRNRIERVANTSIGSMKKSGLGRKMNSTFRNTVPRSPITNKPIANKFERDLFRNRNKKH